MSNSMFDGVLVSDDQLRITALDQALRFHDSAFARHGVTAEEVVKTAQRFFDFLTKD